MKILIKNGRLINPKNQFDNVVDVAIDAEKIFAIDNIPSDFIPQQTIDASGKWIIPGIVDLCARLREPGFEYKATIVSETTAAASAGITTMCCPPDTRPVIDNPSVADLIHHRALQHNKARVVTIGALTQGLQGEQVSEMVALKEAGTVGVGNALMPIKSTLVMRRAMEYAATHELTVFLYAEDPWLRGESVVHEGPVATRMGLEGNPEICETIAVSRDLALIEKTGVRAHFCRLSSLKAARMVARAQYDGLPVSADVSAHQLHLLDMDVGDYSSQYHVRPPLRSIRDRDGLRKAVNEKTINAICSDHQPHDLDAKIGPFSATSPGISSLETLLPLTMRLVKDKVMSLDVAIAALTYQPANILGLDLGYIEENAVADLCIYDPDHVWTLNPDNIQSRGLNTPFMGWEFEGRVTHTFLHGQCVFEL